MNASTVQTTISKDKKDPLPYMYHLRNKSSGKRQATSFTWMLSQTKTTLDITESLKEGAGTAKIHMPIQNMVGGYLAL